MTIAISNDRHIQIDTYDPPWFKSSSDAGV
jgi:hypothetical protein